MSAHWDGSVYARRGLLVRCVYLTIAAACWLLTLGGRRMRRQTVVLCYHEITADQAGRFAWQMRWIAGRAVGCDKLGAARACARGPAVCVTIDDALRNVLCHAVPALREHNIPATVFAVSGNLGRKPGWVSPGHPNGAEPVMSGEELRAAAQRGWFRVGSHSRTHARLDRLPTPVVLAEVVNSKRELEALLSTPVEDLALPHGTFDERTLAAAHQAGYVRVFTLEERPCPAPAPQVVGRFEVSPDLWRIEFVLTAAGAYSWLRPWRRGLGRAAAWLRPRPQPEGAPA